MPWREDLRPAALAHHRICFPAHDPLWKGGVADIALQPGKTVAGALMEISRHGLETLERMAAHSRSKRATVWVTPYVGGPPVQAITCRIGLPDICHVPPSQLYRRRLMQAAAEVGLSMMWVMHLQSFPAIATPERDEERVSSVEIERSPTRIRDRAIPRPTRTNREPAQLVG